MTYFISWSSLTLIRIFFFWVFLFISGLFDKHTYTCTRVHFLVPSQIEWKCFYNHIEMVLNLERILFTTSNSSSNQSRRQWPKATFCLIFLCLWCSPSISLMLEEINLTQGFYLFPRFLGLQSSACSNLFFCMPKLKFICFWSPFWTIFLVRL